MSIICVLTRLIANVVTIVVVGSAAAAAAVLGVKSVSPCGSFEFYNHRPADKFVIS